MLVLSRKLGEAIILDRKIRVVVVGVRGNVVRLGVEAPEEIEVLREELVGEDRKDPSAQPPHKEPPPKGRKKPRKRPDSGN
jgi:carbon storage regulator